MVVSLSFKIAKMQKQVTHKSVEQLITAIETYTLCHLNCTSFNRHCMRMMHFVRKSEINDSNWFIILLVFFKFTELSLIQQLMGIRMYK